MTNFKKGYPHGEGTLLLKNNETVVWKGHFTHGVPTDDTIGENIEQLFDIFTQSPFRRKIKVKYT